MALLEIPRKLFDLELKGSSVQKLLSSALSDIVEIEISKGKSRASGYIVGRKSNDIVIRTLSKLEKNENCEIRFIGSRGIISINSKVVDEVKGISPKMYIIKSPEKISICERRRYYRLELGGDSEVVIKRDNGYAFFCKIKDISLGGFSAIMNIKDKMMEYFLPLINEEVKFSIKITDRKRAFELNGTAKLKHYSLSSSGEYKAGFSFSKLEKRHVKELSEFIKERVKVVAREG